MQNYDNKKQNERNGETTYYLNGFPHRTDGPAVEYANGSYEYLIEGQFHREGGPAIDYIGDFQSYYINGKLHRTDGPAIYSLKTDENNEFWVDGHQIHVKITEELIAHLNGKQ